MEPCPSGESCELCGDVARLARVLAIDAKSGMATVEMEGSELSVALDLVSGVLPGQLVLVHQGFAIERVER